MKYLCDASDLKNLCAQKEHFVFYKWYNTIYFQLLYKAVKIKKGLKTKMLTKIFVEVF